MSSALPKLAPIQASHLTRDSRGCGRDWRLTPVRREQRTPLLEQRMAHRAAFGTAHLLQPLPLQRDRGWGVDAQQDCQSLELLVGAPVAKRGHQRIFEGTGAPNATELHRRMERRGIRSQQAARAVIEAGERPGLLV